MECTPNDAISPAAFKLFIWFLMLLVVVAIQLLLRRLKQGALAFSSDPDFIKHESIFNSFIDNMKWRRNVLAIGFAVVIVTLQYSFSGWALFFLFGFLVSMLVYVNRFVKLLKNRA